MMQSPDISLLIDEYETFVAEAGGIPAGVLSHKQQERILRALVISGNWTSNAADELLYLAKRYGAFMLRNACALSMALEIEDGDAGF